MDFFTWLFAQMTIVQFFNTEMFRGFGVGVINGSLWTISVELTFYIILPLLFLIYKINKWIILLLFCLSFLLWNYDQTNTIKGFVDKLIHVSIFPYLFIFIVGISFYKFYENLKKYIENRFFYWLVGFVLVQSLSSYLKIESNIFISIIIWIFFSFFIFSFAFSFKKLSNTILHGNDYTYGIYIYHMLIINVFVHFNFYGEIKYILFAGMLSLIAGVLSWHVVEKPFLMLKSNSIFTKTH